jgi:glutaminyl-peptide cyclotransferase
MPTRVFARFILALLTALLIVACGGNAAKNAAAQDTSKSAASLPAQAAVPTPPPAPSPEKTGGFDGAKAYTHVAKLVSFGPRPPDSDGIHRAQEYIKTQLKSCGCTVEEDDFHASTPIGSLAMKNIIGKASGEGSGIILLLTHYDTVRVENFVGAEDGGSSTGLLLEMARVLCGRKQANAVWIAFLDGEEAQVQWSDTDSVYGSRELAAKMAVSGDLKRVKAVILADMIGQNGLEIPRESNSTRWLTDLVWSTAARLGYGSVFVSREGAIEDDHLPFLHRGVPSVDLIDYGGFQPYWHTPADTLDKVSPQSLAIVGHVILQSVSELQKKFR